MKKILTLSVLILSLLVPVVAPVAAAPILEDKDKSTISKSFKQTEKDLLNACLSEKGNDPAECKCVLTNMKTELKGKDYQFLMTLLTLALKDQDEAVGELVMEKSIISLLMMAKRLEQAAKKVEKQCDGVNLKFDLKSTQQKA